MKTIISATFLFLFLVTVSNNLFSQSIKILKPSKIGVPQLDGCTDRLPTDLLLNNIFTKISQKSNQETFNVLDSVIIKNADSTIEKQKYTYDYERVLTSMIRENWSETYWKNCDRCNYTYDSKENITSMLEEDWDGTKWINKLRITNTYESNGKLASELEESWWSGEWQIQFRKTYTYDSNMNLISVLAEEEGDGTNWDNKWRDNYSYDSNGKLITLLYEDWIGYWVNSVHSTYTYDSNGKLISLLYENWGGANWVNYSSSTYTYDSNDNLTSEQSENWDGTSWANPERYTYIYDSYANLTSWMMEIWDENNWILSNRDGHLGLHSNSIQYNYFGVQVNIYYKIITDVKNQAIEIKEYTLLQNYPNPFNPTTTINYSISTYTHARLKIFDILGNEVATIVDEYKNAGDYNVVFNASSLSSGIYFYRLECNNYVDTKKLILLK